MSLLLIVAISGAVLVVAYLTYGRFLSQFLELDSRRPTPAVELRDGVDYDPIEPKFLLSQHFSAIAAAGPIVGPILLAMGLDPVWLGVMMAVNLQTSFLTPPFGFALFYLRGVAPETVATSDIYRGVMPFILLQLIGLTLVAAFPALATWLPDLVYGH